jgi:hypothetical protein
MNSGEIIAIAIGAVALIAIFLFSGGIQSLGISGSKNSSSASAQSTQSGSSPSASGGSLVIAPTYNVTNEEQYQYTYSPTDIYAPQIKTSSSGLVGIGSGNAFLPPVYFPK